MKAVLLFLAAAVTGPLPMVLGQGQFVLNNRVPPEINAPFVLCTDPAGASSLRGNAYHVQVLAGREGVSFDPNQATVSVTTDFRTGAAAGYVNPLTITVPGIPGGQLATVRVRAFKGDDWNSSPVRYEGIFVVIVDEAPGSPLNLFLGTSPLVLCDQTAPPPDDGLETWTPRGPFSQQFTGIFYGGDRFVVTNVGLDDGGLRAYLSGDPGQNLALEVSADLTHWVELLSFILPPDRIVTLPVGLASTLGWFYRAVAQ